MRTRARGFARRRRTATSDGAVAPGPQGRERSKRNPSVSAPANRRASLLTNADALAPTRADASPREQPLFPPPGRPGFAPPRGTGPNTCPTRTRRPPCGRSMRLAGPRAGCGNWWWSPAVGPGTSLRSSTTQGNPHATVDVASTWSRSAACSSGTAARLGQLGPRDGAFGVHAHAHGMLPVLGRRAADGDAELPGRDQILPTRLLGIG